MQKTHVITFILHICIISVFFSFFFVPKDYATDPNCPNPIDPSWVNSYSTGGCFEDNTSTDEVGYNSVTSSNSSQCIVQSNNCSIGSTQSCFVKKGNSCYAGSGSSGFSNQSCSQNSNTSFNCPNTYRLSIKVTGNGNQSLKNIQFRIDYEGWINFPEQNTKVKTDSNGNASLDLYSGDRFVITPDSKGYVLNPKDPSGSAECTSNPGNCEMNTNWSCGTPLGTTGGSNGTMPPCEFVIKSAPTPTPTPSPSPTPTPTPFVSGNVFNDTNDNGKKDNGESGINGMQVTATNNNNNNLSFTGITDNKGDYTISIGKYGPYNVSIPVPGGKYQDYTVTTNNNPASVTVDQNTNPSVIFGIVQLFSISGNIYNDIDGNQYFRSPDTAYTGGGKITITGGPGSNTYPIAVQNDGTYTTKNTLLPGTYTVTYNGPPATYYMTYPLTSSPPSFSSLEVGPTCTNQFNDEKCNNGNASGINFGITNRVPWIQNVCGDMRQDTGITDKVPPAPSCGGYSGAYAIQSNPAICSIKNGGPGIAFSGDVTADFGQGQASVNNWVIGNGIQNSEIFNGTIHTSYDYLFAKTQQAGIPIIDLAKQCGNGGISSCNLNKNLTHGVYQATGDLYLQPYNFTGNQNYVILVKKGNLYIQGNITIDPGSSVTFAVNGNITVDASVGNPLSNNTPPDITTPDVEGFYIADDSFIINGKPNICTTGLGDNTLVIRGSIVVNATHTNGSFVNKRNLCGSNPVCPAISIVQRPDLLLKAPSFIETMHHSWQEVAP